jgi:hypothetical protein
VTETVKDYTPKFETPPQDDSYEKWVDACAQLTAAREPSIAEIVRRDREALERLQAEPWERMVRELSAERDNLAAELIRVKCELENVTAERDMLAQAAGRT